MLVIIPCGGAKESSARPAHLLYKGGYFKACLEYALSLTTANNIRILSSRYGLLKLDQIVSPYEMRITDAGAISDQALRAQAEEQGLINETDVTIIAGKDYGMKALKIWASAKTPLFGVGIIGKQMKFLKTKTREARNV